jgi:thymidylate synthase
MKQYLELAEAVKTRGTYKAPAREGMPGTTSLFGYQFRHDLSEGFPILTTKKISFKNIVTELLWFLRGDTNIRYLVKNGCDIWNEDSYSYYVKMCDRAGFPAEDLWSFEEFEAAVKDQATRLVPMPPGYTLGDCGKQYGWLWRSWGGVESNLGKFFMVDVNNIPPAAMENMEETLIEMRNICKDIGILPLDLSSKQTASVDQLKELIHLLKTNPLSRRLIISAWNPTTLNDMALNACHALVQFNCRPLSHAERVFIFESTEVRRVGPVDKERLDSAGVPEYKLDCQMYQRSADLFLGVPYNISSYALLTHILCEICNMVPGDFIHTFGDVHIYDNHKEQIDEQLTREPKPLPTLEVVAKGEGWSKLTDVSIDLLINTLDHKGFKLKDYKSHPAIKGELSTGIKK